MKKRILSYRKRIDETIEQNSPNTDWAALMEEHLQQIQFFQHERLIHLMVTILFAIMAFMAIILAYIAKSVATIALFAAILILLIPYIKHYYLMENETQKMYDQYDIILERMKK